MKTGLIYRRVSTDEQAKEGQSIEAQDKLCRQFAKDNSIKIPKDGVYTDEGKSGSNTRRPGLQSLLDRATSVENIDVILVLDTDRLARNTLDHLSIKSILRKHDVQLISISQPMIDDSPEGRFIDVVLAGANALQSQITGRKTSKVMEEKVKAGWWANQAPLGYKNVLNPNSTSNLDKRIIIPHPEKGALITRMYELYASGTYTIETITQKMNNLKLTTNQGKPLQKSLAHRILSHEIYHGKIPWKGKLYNGKHQPLVSKPVWDTCQQIMTKHNQHASRTRKHDYLLRGYVYCADTDERYWEAPHKGNTTTKEYYFRKTNPKGTYVDVEDLEKQAEEWFGYVQITDAYADELLTAAKGVLSELRGQHDNERKALLTHKTNLVDKKRNLEDRFIDGNLEVERFNSLMDRLETQENDIDDALSYLGGDYNQNFEGIKRVVNMARNIQQTYIDADKDLKRQYLDLFFEKLLVRDGSIVEAVPSLALKPLIKDGRVRVNEHWLRGLTEVRTYFISG